MHYNKLLIGFFLLGGLSSASYLSVYKDKVSYTYSPTHTFVGFTQAVTAKSQGNIIPMQELSACTLEYRLCKTSQHLKQLEREKNRLFHQVKALNTLLQNVVPQTINTKTWISEVKLFAKEQSQLSEAQKTVNSKLNIARKAFRQEVPSLIASAFLTLPKEEVTLSIPHRQIPFRTFYEATLSETEITVTQSLSLVNRSGIDIQADTAMFYYRYAQQYVNATHFRPWIVSQGNEKMFSGGDIMPVEAAPQPVLMAKRSLKEAPVFVEEVVIYGDTREYQIKNLSLPSTGLAKNVEVLKWKASVSCEIKAYPYNTLQAFHICTFTPKYQIDANEWKVKSNGKIINDKARGEYKNKVYQLYTQIEEDIQISRKSIVQKDSSKGLFGGSVRKKDGFEIIIKNKSNKSKSLTLIERIPTSSTQAIEAKLLSIKSAQKVNYRLLDEGKIEIKIALKAGESKTITVLFELSYDKGMEVYY